jgi:SAM-dependent methyltransferase
MPCAVGSSREPKMKIRDSGMPDPQSWESFFEPPLVLHRLGFSSRTEDVADLGCGYGTFSIPAARLTSGIVHAFDIDREMIEATDKKARNLGLSNVMAVERDFVAEGTGLSEGSTAYAMLFNVLHAEDAISLLSEAFRILRAQGVLGVIHWVHDARTPRGPDLSIRPRPEQCSTWAAEVGFVLEGSPILLPPYHYGLILRKPG